MPRNTSILWLFTGAMVLIAAAASGSVLSGVATAVSAVAGVGEQAIVTIAGVTLLAGFAAGLIFGLRDLAGLARRGAPGLPGRWMLGSLVALPAAGPLWNYCVAQIQEPITGSTAARVAFDEVMYALVLALMLPLGIGVPLVLKRLRPRVVTLGLLVLLQASCAATPSMPADATADLAPGGTLRTAINFGNPILATRDPDTGEPRGVSVDIARELAQRLDVSIQLVTYEAAGRVVQDVGTNAWDVAFVAIDPARATDISFTAPYVVIEGAYLVPEASPIRGNDDVDRDGVRVMVGDGSAYDLFLSRTLQRATLVRAPTSPAVVDTMVAQQVEVAAGVRQQLETDARRIGGLRLLDGRFMAIEQAMAVPRGRVAGAAYLREFIEDLKRSGFVSAALERHGIEGVSVGPPAAP